ncbi:hypothetical protein H0H93_005505 [Arthromyces matolae]|nr:hypothetical protein H0H93_005505 [Arthromyces matolae]
MPVDLILAALNLGCNAATVGFALLPDKTNQEILFQIQSAEENIQKSRHDIREFSLYLTDTDIRMFYGRLNAVATDLTNFKSRVRALTYVGKWRKQEAIVNEAREISDQSEEVYNLVTEASTLAKMKYETENGLRLVIQRDPSVSEQEQVESIREALTELSFVQQPELPSTPEEPRPPVSGRNISSISSIFRPQPFPRVLGTSNVIPFLLSRVAQNRGSVALPSITLDPPNLTRPIEMSDMDPRRESLRTEDESVTGNVD